MARRKWPTVFSDLQQAPLGRAGLCVPVSIANATTLLGKPVNLDHILKLMEANGVLAPGEGMVFDIAASVTAVQSYSRRNGVKIHYQAILPRGEFIDFGVPDVARPPRAATLIVTLDNSYIRKYHTMVDQVPAQLAAGQGSTDGHCVNVLWANEDEVGIFDCDPSLKPEFRRPGLPAGVVVLPKPVFDLHHTQFVYSREAIVLELHASRKPKKKQPTMAKDQVRLEHF